MKKPKINFLNLDPKHCAHSLTKKDKESLRSIRAVEYYHELWEDTRTPIIKNEIRSLRKAIASFNKTCYWIATEICTQPEKSNRALVISQSIKMANVCFKLKNYNTALAIVSGLNALAVSRLKQTWEAVDAKRLKQLEEMESFLSPLSNFKAYRSAMDQHIQSSTASSTPIVPILGIFVKDLVFMNDGNPKFVAGQPEGTVNFDKLRAIYTNVCRMVQLQRTAYPESLFHDIPSQVDGYLENMPVLKEDALYKYSCLCEAKSGDGDTLRLRDKWMKNP